MRGRCNTMVGNTTPLREITGGVDTHADTHTVAALDELGRLLGHQHLSWLKSLVREVRTV